MNEYSEERNMARVQTAARLIKYYEFISNFKEGGYICKLCGFIMPLNTTPPFKNNCSYCFGRPLDPDEEVLKTYNDFKPKELNAPKKEVMKRRRPPVFQTPEEHFKYYRNLI